MWPFIFRVNFILGLQVARLTLQDDKLTAEEKGEHAGVFRIVRGSTTALLRFKATRRFFAVAHLLPTVCIYIYMYMYVGI